MLIINSVFSQDNHTQKKLESLEVALSKATTDSTKLNLLKILGYDYALHTNEKNIKFNQKAIDLGTKLNIPMAIADAYLNYAIYYERINDTLRQTKYIDKILALGKEKKDNNILGKGYYEKAFSYWNKKNLNQAIYYLEKSEKIYKKLGDKFNLSNVYL